MRDLALLSGGPDSVFALKWALDCTDADVVSLFVYLGDPVSKAAKDAVDRIVPYLCRTSRPFRHRVLSIAGTGGSSLHYNVTLAFAVAYLSAELGPFRRVYRGDSQEEQLGVRPAQEGAGLSGEAVFQHALEGCLDLPGLAPAPIVPEQCLPGKPLSKVDYIAAMDPELRAMLWSCPRPRFAAGTYRPCGECYKCQFLEKARS